MERTTRRTAREVWRMVRDARAESRRRAAAGDAAGAGHWAAVADVLLARLVRG